MSQSYVFDACALIAFFTEEPGGERVVKLLRAAQRRRITINMNTVNVLEAYYGVWRMADRKLADEMLRLVQAYPIRLADGLSDEVFAEAARLKAAHRISLADAIALAEAKTRGAKVVTSDHHEFDILESKEDISFYWIR